MYFSLFNIKQSKKEKKIGKKRNIKFLLLEK